MSKTEAFDRFADWLTSVIGSNGSLIIHTLIFIGFFLLYLLGYSFDTILLVLTTIVSLEAIYLSIIIQRSVNKQSSRIDRMVKEIRENTVPHLKEPLDEVVGEIKGEVDDLDSRMRNLESRKKKKR